MNLPDSVAVYPTHGGGSFCSAAAPGGGSGSTTIGLERVSNPFAVQSQESSFIQFALSDLGSYPRYFKYMADINRRGPDVLGGIPHLASLTPLSARHQMEESALLVDARPEKVFNQEHVPGAFSVPYGNNFSAWVGWVVPWAQPLLLLSSDPANHDGMVRQLIRIGWDRLNGALAGGLEAWKGAGLSTESTRRVDLPGLRKLQDQPQAPLIIDVRQRKEFHEGHIDGALNIELRELPDHLDGLPRDLPVITVCASGMRSTTAGSILQRDGRENVQVVEDGGFPQWSSLGYPVETGE